MQYQSKRQGSVTLLLSSLIARDVSVTVASVKYVTALLDHRLLSQ